MEKKFYTKQDLKRIASVELASDLFNEPKLTFDNVSYGWGGECLGTIGNSRYIDIHKGDYWKVVERYIYYVLREDWRNKTIELKKVVYEKYWGSDYQDKPRSECVKEQETTLMTLYYVDKLNRLYTEDEQIAKEADEKRQERQKQNNIYINEIKRQLQPHTKLYDKVFTKICNKVYKKLVYGCDITYLKCERYDYYNNKYYDIYYTYIYRKQPYRIKIATFK